MQKFIKINPETKLFVEDIISTREDLEVEGNLPKEIIEVSLPIDVGFYLPKWDGSQWVEGLSQVEIEAKKPKQSPNWEQ